MDHFALFGLVPSPDLDVAALEAKYRELSLSFHPDRNPGSRVEAAAKTAALNEAVKVLRDPVRRAFYVLSLKGVDLDKQTMPMDFLEGILEQREQLEGARKDLGRVRALAGAIEKSSDEALARGQAALRAGDTPVATAELAKVRYYQRFMEEVEAIEEEAAA